MQGALRRAWRRVAQECSDALQYGLLPALAAVLPWRWAFAVFRWAAASPGLYRADTAQALAHAIAHGACSPQQAEAFASERRLVHLVDQADHYLYRTRSQAWLKRHVDVVGQWSHGERAGMLWTFHWGAGLWALCHAEQSGMRAQMVLASPQGPDFAGRSLFSAYIKARMRSVQLALGRPVVFVPGSMAGVRAAIGRQEQLVVVMDVPQDQVAGAVRTERMLGQAVSVPAVLPDLAVALELPVTVFSMGLDVATGRRQLHITPLGVQSDAAQLSTLVFAELESLLQRQPAAWHLWSQAPRFFHERMRENAPPTTSQLPS